MLDSRTWLWANSMPIVNGLKMPMPMRNAVTMNHNRLSRGLSKGLATLLPPSNKWTICNKKNFKPKGSANWLIPNVCLISSKLSSSMLQRTSRCSRQVKHCMSWYVHITGPQVQLYCQQWLMCIVSMCIYIQYCLSIATHHHRFNPMVKLILNLHQWGPHHRYHLQAQQLPSMVTTVTNCPSHHPRLAPLGNIHPVLVVSSWSTEGFGGNAW